MRLTLHYYQVRSAVLFIFEVPVFDIHFFFPTSFKVCEKKETILSRALMESKDVLNSQLDAAARAQAEAEISILENELVVEKQRFLRQRNENIRRKHNYLQFIMALLTAVAKKGKLPEMIEKAKTRKALATQKKSNS